MPSYNYDLKMFNNYNLFGIHVHGDVVNKEKQENSDKSQAGLGRQKSHESFFS